MGSRVNAALRTNADVNEHIFLYSHNGGWCFPKKIKYSLQHCRQRWGDNSYAARMFVSYVVGDQWGGALEFGLSLQMTDNNYDVFEIDFVDQQVRLFKYGMNGETYQFEVYFDREPLGEWSFAEYVELEDTELDGWLMFQSLQAAV